MFCVRCGRKLPGNYNKCNQCPPGARENAWYCPYCGAGVKKNSKKCDVCGKALDLSPAAYVKAAPEKLKKRKTAAVLAIFLGFLGLHHKYMGQQSRFVRRILWSALSAVVAVASLIIFRAGINPAFENGYDPEVLESMALFVFTMAGLVAAGTISLLISWIKGVAEGIMLLRKNNVTDGNGNPMI